jgi:hypothetical protein
VNTTRMLLPRTTCGVAGPSASLHDALTPRQASPVGSKAALILSEVLVGLAALAAWTTPLQAGTIAIPNGSFESPVVPPVTPYAVPDMDYWQKSPQPGWYDPSQNFNTPWEDLMGTFYNVPYPSTFIGNCDGTQAAFLFALPDAAVFQDYDSIYGTNTTPSHAFNARFNVNSAYSLSVGVIGGVDGAPPLYEGATLQLSLYYRDAASNMVMVAATTITNSAQLFPTNTHFIDFSVQLPAVQATDPWAGQHIGVQIASTVGFDKANGYWDVDNARLTETVVPAFADARTTNSQFGFTVQSEPGLRFEILATTNLAVPISNWTSLGTLTNVTGTALFFDPATNLNRRFYQARQLP